jgi:hypothetical protein
MELKKLLQELERCFQEKERELMRKLHEVTVAASQAALEQTHLANEELQLEQELRQHEAREAEFVCERKDTENHLLVAKERLEKDVYPNKTFSVCGSSLHGDIYIEVTTKTVVLWVIIAMWRSLL